MDGMVQPLFYPIRQAALEFLCELDEIVETVEDSSHHFARLTKDGSLVGVCTELEKPLSSKSASRIGRLLCIGERDVFLDTYDHSMIENFTMSDIFSITSRPL